MEIILFIDFYIEIFIWIVDKFDMLGADTFLCYMFFKCTVLKNIVVKHGDNCV